MSAAELAAVAIVAAIVSIGYWLTHPDHLYDDSPDYLVSANSLAEGRGFTSRLSPSTPPAWRFAKRTASWKIDEVQGEVEVMRTPGYPAFLAAMRLAGLTPPQVTVVQLLLRIAAIVLFVLFAAAIGVPFCARLLAAGWLVIDQWGLWCANKIVTETLFTIVLFAVVWMTVAALRAGRIGVGRVVVLGMLVGAATLVRPVAIAYFVVVAFCVAVFVRQHRWRSTAIVLIAAIVLPLAWAWRNQRQTGIFTLSLIIPIDKVFYRAAGAEAIGMPGDYETNLIRLHGEYKERVARLGPASTAKEKLARYDALANGVLRRHWRGAVRLALHELRMLMFRVYRCTTCGAFKNVAKVALFFAHVAFLACAVAGAIAMMRRDLAVGAFLALTVAYFVLVPAGGGGRIGRFRAPIESYYALFAACGACSILAFRPGTVRR